jgi:antitoxin (DNA-binding transcriptional repressor) of toxin-antitoxin stability system
VRSARKYGSILVRDRHRPVARITPASEEPEVNRFAAWKPLKKFAARLHRPFAARPSRRS